MHKITLTVAAALAALIALAAPAGAATPFTAGTGSGARIAADQDGYGHVVWGIPAKSGEPAKVGYCRIPPGGSACDVSKELPFPSASGQVAQGDPLDVAVYTPRAMEIVVVGSCTSCGDGSPVDHVYRWVSTTSGAGFSSEFQLGTTPTSAGMQTGGSWMGPESNTLIMPGEGNRALVFASAGATANTIKTVGPGFVYSPSIARVPVAGGAPRMIVYASSSLSAIQYAVYTGGADNSAYDGIPLSDQSKWSYNEFADSGRTLVPVQADSAEPSLSSGPTSLFLTYRRLVPGDNQILIRRFNSDVLSKTFGSATVLQGGDAIDDSADAPDSTQDISGRVHVVWTSQHDGGRLRYILSDVSGTTFTTAVSVARGETFVDPDVAAAPSGAGWAAWSTGGDAAIRVVKLEAISDAPVVVPPPVKPPIVTPPLAPKPLTKTVSVKGATITFGLPRACVKRGSTFKATLTWKKQQRKGNLFVKVAKADFYIGSKIVRTDTTAPFTQTLTVKATTTAGSKMTVRARAHIKVKRGKSPKKSITSSIKVCA